MSRLILQRQHFHQPRRRAAFATITAIALIVFVGVALLALTTLVAQNVKRNLRDAEDAQLRQLLIAGQIAAGLSLDQPAGANSTVALPTDLSESGYSVRYSVTDNQPANRAAFDVVAASPSGRILSQEIRYQMHDNACTFRSAELH